MTPPTIPQWRNRAVIVLIALLAFIPFALAWLVAQHPEWVGSHSNYGRLILPPRPLAYEELSAHPVSPVAELAELKGRWVMVQIAPGACGQTCLDTLHKTHQVRLMTNKEIPRLKRLLLVPEANAAEFPAQLRDEALLVGGASEALLRTFTEAVGHPPGEGAVLLLDPFANLILWYDDGFDPYGLLKDLKHLLRASQIG